MAAHYPTPDPADGGHEYHSDHSATLDAVHRLEAALAVAAPGREKSWRDDVLGALATLEGAMLVESVNAARPDSLLSDIKRTQPRLRSRVRGINMQYRQLCDALGSLRHELDPTKGESSPPPDFADIRQRLAWLLTALRHQRARESDLIHEAYFDAYQSSLDRDETS